MTRQEKILKAIDKQKILPAFFHEEQNFCVKMLQILYRSGIRVAEFTMQGQHGLPNFKAVRRICVEILPDMYIGVGNIRSSDIAHSTIDAGADFLMSPVFDTGVCDVAYLHKTLWIPGCMTPSEIHDADKAGCKVMQLFPANILDPGFLESVKEIFPGLSFIPSGNISPDVGAILPWLHSGALAVRVGSCFITRAFLENKQENMLPLTIENLLNEIALNY